jgi:hypothetical protein
MADQEGSQKGQQKPRPLPNNPNGTGVTWPHIQVAGTGIRIPDNMLLDEEEK